jgi:hypothetical protein
MKEKEGVVAWGGVKKKTIKLGSFSVFVLRHSAKILPEK